MKKFFFFLSLTLVMAACNSSKKTAAATPGTFLTGTNWKLIKVRDMMDHSAAGSRTLVLEIPDKKGKGKFSGQGGCNTFNGNYKADNDKKTVSFSDIASTKVACSEMKKEDEYFSLLKSANSYRLADGILKLYNGGDLLLTFQSK